MTAMRTGDRLERADRVLEHGEREAEGRWQAGSTVLLVSGDVERGKEEDTGKAIRTNDGDGVSWLGCLHLFIAPRGANTGGASTMARRNTGDAGRC